MIRTVALLAAALGAAAVPLQPAVPRNDDAVFEIANGSFVKDGQAVRILGGALHYWRVPRAYWRDRLERIKALGLNTVETYVPWNLHEPEPGVFDFSGNLDLDAFLEVAEEVGLDTIVRPGSYICAEHTFGGLPYWLLKDRSMQLRSSDPTFLAAMTPYMERVLAIAVPRQYNGRGKGVIALQIENEYGYYSNDQVYLQAIADMFRAAGFTGVLVTSDGPLEFAQQGGALVDEALATVNLDNSPDRGISILQQLQPGMPTMVMELWLGWFTYWGGNLESRSPEGNANLLDAVLSNNNSSFVVYMIHGGTNFGFTNGASSFTGTGAGATTRPVITSYDYDAVIGEAGDCGLKFELVNAVLNKHFGVPIVAPPAPPARTAYGTVAMTASVPLFDVLDVVGRTPVTAPFPRSMEDLNQSFGLTLYRTSIPNSFPTSQVGAISPTGVDDWGMVFINGQLRRTIASPSDNVPVAVTVPAGGETEIEVLTYELGRVNFGPTMPDQRKGLGNILFNTQFLSGYTMTPLPLEGDDVSSIDFSSAAPPAAAETPTFYKGSFSIPADEAPRDTFLRCDGWTFGVAYVNGFNLGRYWPAAGPQMTLFVPASVLVSGVNELILFELEGANTDFTVTLVDEPDLGSPRP